MPRVTLYIRDNDYDKWKLIKNKSELVSQAINRSEINGVVEKSGKVKLVHTVHPPAEIISAAPAEFQTISHVDINVAKASFCGAGHFLAPGRDKCNQKGCKYAT